MSRAMKCVLLTMGVSGSAGCAMPIHTGQLLREMIDLSRLTDVPQPAFKTVQFSSYDRASALPGGPGWFANNDGFGNEATPNFEAVLKAPDESGIGEYLICDVEGPGAIVRTWTAACTGDIRLYLDDAKTPLYDGPAADFLTCPYRAFAKAAGIDESLLNGTFQQSLAGYCPIPFAKRCRMIWIGNVKQVHFYHVQIRRYVPGVPVKTFEPEDLKACAADVGNVARVLADPQREYAATSETRSVTISATVPARREQEVLKLEGPQALERLTLKVYAQDLDRALRQTILHIVCDDCPWGQVQAPLGDFFGAAPGINPFDSLPITVSSDGTMTCRYIMPFKQSLKIVIDNRSEQSVTVTGSALPMDYMWDDETSMHFRARWRVNHGLLASPQAVQDLPFLVANGSGRLVGTAIMLLNPCGVPTPYGAWWGEGDEKIFVDDDTFPSTFGTGSEDYFNYGWSVPDIFGHAYCGQPRCDGPGNRGFVTNHRWHILDDLPFQSRVAFYLELYPHDRVPGMSYARIAYHYARPGTMDDHVAITDEDTRPLALPANWQPAAGFGMRDSLYYHAEELAQPGSRVTLERDNLWAGGQLLVWHPATRGEQLEFRVPIVEDGKYALHIAFAHDERSGRISFELNGEPIGFGGGGILDLYVPYRVLSRQYGADVVELTKGEHVLTLQYEGAPESVSEPTIGVDYVAVQKR
ncbi:MAG: DUF2961 domain-containing protein [Phycisphaerae bacterium]